MKVDDKSTNIALLAVQALLWKYFFLPNALVTGLVFPVQLHLRNNVCDRWSNNNHNHMINRKINIGTRSWSELNMAIQPNKRNRENEIRQKIMKLKKEGKISKPSSSEDNDSNISDNDTSLDRLKQQRLKLKNSPTADAYAFKVSQRLGKKGKIMSQIDDENTGNARLGSLVTEGDDKSDEVVEKLPNDETIGDESDFEYDDDELQLLDAVKSKLMESREQENLVKLSQKGTLLEPDMEERAQQMEAEMNEKSNDNKDNISVKKKNEKGEKLTSGIGGSWSEDDSEEAQTESYRPARGSWGYFPRPKNISTAYGGGRKVGADAKVTADDEFRKQKSVDDTKDKLRAYREKVGIDVQSEKDHAGEIETALSLGKRAMQRGRYSTAVSSLEKVTMYCSTNSKVGGEVFLELAMAYEAMGETDKAIQVYSTLSYCRIEKIKISAQRLLYGIEAMNFMRNDVKAKSFSREKASQTFIDTTGMQNIAQNFDKVYNTAYVDLDSRGGFYKKLTENVVRSVREARQILLRATSTGDVERMKVIQALRSLTRNFDDALTEEIKNNAPKEESVAVMNGVPIITKSKSKDSDMADMEKFILGSASQMKELLNGEWKLQLMADKKGEGVNLYNSTLSWQFLDSEEMKFESFGPAGFLTFIQKGDFDFDDERRILIHSETAKSEGSGAWLAGIMSKSKPTGALAANTIPQQIISVDSTMLITRNALDNTSITENSKDYFSIWRKVDVGTYSKQS